jgi:glycerate kinase
VKVLICPDSFTGTLSAAQACAAMAEGWASVSPGDELVLRPLSDGGPGFVDAIAAARGGVRHALRVTGPVGDPVLADLLITDGDTAWIESASAAGLHLVPNDRRDPTGTTSRGVGELMRAALDRGATRIVVGVGGTGTCDGGAGLLAALGARSQPPGALSRGGGPLAGLTSLELESALAAVGAIDLEVATDVDVPLLGARGAARGFGPQKGASEEQVDHLEASMSHWARLLGRTADGRSPAVALGAGAGGGLGAALIRLGARRIPGIGTVLGAADIAGVLEEADLVITGEGSFDWQSLRGKVVAGVAAAALERGVPVLVLAGRVELSRREWITAGVAAAFPAAAEPDESHHQGVALAAARAARTWSRR